MMGTIEAHRDVVWSTPIQSRNDSGYEPHDAFGCSLDISPIRKKASYRPTLVALLKKNCTLEHGSDKEIREVKKVNRKLFTNWFHAKETASPEQIDSGIESICETADSEIQSNENSSYSGSQSLNHYLKSFPTDLNCDIRKYGNCNCKFYQPYKYICKEGLNQYEYSKSDVCFSQLLDKNNNTFDYVSQVNKSIHGINFLYELNSRDCLSIISQILSYLPDEDLRKASYVSKDWQNIILSDKEANKRRVDYINNRRNITRGPNKENRFQIKCLNERSHKSVFLSIINTSSEVSQQPLYNDNLVGKFDSFYQEVKTLQDIKLMKCPKCKYPSKIESGNKYCCTRSLCQHEFCQKCSGPYLDNHICSEPKFENTSCIFICSKKSKKYLRRL